MSDTSRCTNKLVVATPTNFVVATLAKRSHSILPAKASKRVATLCPEAHLLAEVTDSVSIQTPTHTSATIAKHAATESTTSYSVITAAYV